MAETSDPAAPLAPVRRRPSVVYDPARDVFQTVPDTLSTVHEEDTNPPAKREVLDPRDSSPPTPLGTKYPIGV
jgi:hypothetical protein